MDMTQHSRKGLLDTAAENGDATSEQMVGATYGYTSCNRSRTGLASKLSRTKWTRSQGWPRVVTETENRRH